MKTSKKGEHSSTLTESTTAIQRRTSRISHMGNGSLFCIGIQNIILEGKMKTDRQSNQKKKLDIVRVSHHGFTINQQTIQELGQSSLMSSLRSLWECI